MRMRAVVMLIVAVVLGGAAALLARNLLQSRNVAPQVANTGPAVTTVVVARRALHFGDAVNRDVVSEVPWPATATPAGSFKKADELFAKPGRRVALREIAQGEPLLKDRISGFGGRAILSTQIDEKMRAITIRVNDVYGVAGFVVPGDRVDVLLIRSQGNQNSTTTETLLQNLKVLGIDQDASEQTDKPRVVKAVTLEVTPDETQKLALAATVGTLSLALRNATNTAQARLPRITVRDLGVAPPPAAPMVVAEEKAPSSREISVSPQLPTVIVVRGVEAKVVEVVPEVGAARRITARRPAQSSAPPKMPIITPQLKAPIL